MPDFDHEPPNGKFRVVGVIREQILTQIVQTICRGSKLLIHGDDPFHELVSEVTVGSQFATHTFLAPNEKHHYSTVQQNGYFQSRQEVEQIQFLR